MTTPHKQNTVFPITADHLVFCGNNVGLDGDVHIQTQEHTSKIHLDNHTVFEKELNVKDKINDNDGDNIFQLSTNDTKIEHNKLTKFNQNIDFNDKEVTNLAGFDGKFTSSQILSSNRLGQSAPNNTLDKEIDDILIDVGNNTNRTSGLTTNKIMRSNNSGTLQPATFDVDKIVRNDLTSQQELVGDINLASGKRIKYNNVAIEINDNTKLDKDFGNIGSNILPEANTDSSIARVLALNNGLDLKADKTGVVFTGDVSLNTGAITASKPLEVNAQKKIVTSTNLLMTQAERDAIPLNTAKTGITAQQASDIQTNNAKTGITAQQASDIQTNNAKIGITTQQASDIQTNNAKTGITSQQASDIQTNNAKTGITAQQSSDIQTNNAKTGITSAQSTAITTNTSNITTITNNYIKKDGSVDFDGNILVPTLEVGTTDYTITKDGNNDLTMNIPTGEIYNFKINNSLIAKVDSGGIDLANGKGFSVDGSALTSTDPNSIKKNVDNQEIACNDFSFSAGDSGDLTVRLKADTDNSDENDNPRLILEQDGGGVTGIISMDGNNDFNFDGSTNAITNTNIICGNNSASRIRLKHGTSTKIQVEASKNVLNQNTEITGNLTLSGRITCGDNDGDGLYFGSDNKPKITAFGDSLIIECNDSSKNVIFKTFQSSTSATTQSFTISDDYAEIDDGYGLRVKNITANSIVKTDGDSKLVAGTLALSDIPSGVAKLASTNLFTGANTFTSNSSFSYYPTNDLILNRDAVIMTHQIFNNSLVSNTNVEYCAKRGCVFLTGTQTITGDKTFSGALTLPTTLHGTNKFLSVDSNGVIQSAVPPATDISGKANIASPTLTGTTTIPILKITDKIQFEGSGYVAFNQGTEANGGNMIYDIPTGDGSLLFAFRIGGVNHALIYADGIKAPPNKKFVDSDGGFYPQANQLALKASPTFTGTVNLATLISSGDITTNGDLHIEEGGKIFLGTSQSNEPSISEFSDSLFFNIKSTAPNYSRIAFVVHNASNTLHEALQLLGGSSFHDAHFREGFGIKIRGGDFVKYNSDTAVEANEEFKITNSQTTINNDVVISGLTASLFVKTDSNKKLVSGTIQSADLPQNVIVNNADNQTITCNNFSISSGTSGDFTLKLKADTDNSNEDDNPKLILEQDGGAINGVIEMNNSNNFDIYATASISNLILSSGSSSNASLHLRHGNTSKILVKNDRIEFKDAVYLENNTTQSITQLIGLLDTRVGTLEGSSWTTISFTTDIRFVGQSLVSALSSGMGSNGVQFKKQDDKVHIRGVIQRTGGFSDQFQILEINDTSYYPQKTVKKNIVGSKDNNDTVSDATLPAVLLICGSDAGTSLQGKIFFYCDRSADPYTTLSIDCDWWLS